MPIYYTKEERTMLKDYATIMTDSKSARKIKRYTWETSIKIIDLINRYGEDGYGDKPKDMNRVQYWLAHLE